MTTTIQRAPTQEDAGRPRVRTLRVGMLGLGTVGEALCRLVRSRRTELARRHGLRIEMAAALVRDATRDRAIAEVTADAGEFLRGDYDCVVEAMGGTEPAGTYVAQLLKRGVPVVSANKALLAERGAELAQLGAPLFAEASVAAGIPLLSVLDRSLQSTRVDTVTAILNGTSNFVLTRVARSGVSLGAAVEEAYRAGFAEADPTLDLNGTDAAQKLSLLVGRIGRRALPVDAIERESIAGVRPQDVRRAAAFGYALKPVAWSDLSSGFVAPALVPTDHPLSLVDHEANAVVVEGDPTGLLCFSGLGAGGAPTAASIIDDLIAVARGETSEWIAAPLPGTPPPIATRWFVTLEFAADGDQPDAAVTLLKESGLAIRELRRLSAEAVPVLALVLAPATAERIQTVLETLRTLRALNDARAFRVIQE